MVTVTTAHAESGLLKRYAGTVGADGTGTIKIEADLA